MRGPRSAPLIRGTGGLRKLRFSRRREQIGKRGGARVCYAYFEKHRTVLLVMAYGKDEKDDLSATEKRAIVPVTRAPGRRRIEPFPWGFERLNRVVFVPAKCSRRMAFQAVSRDT